VCDSIQNLSTTKHAWVATVPLLPERAGNDDDARRPWPVLVWKEGAAESWLHAEHGEIVLGDEP